MPANGGRCPKEKLFCEVVIWDPTLLKGLYVGDFDDPVLIVEGLKEEDVWCNVPIVEAWLLPDIFDSMAGWIPSLAIDVIRLVPDLNAFGKV